MGRKREKKKGKWIIVGRIMLKPGRKCISFLAFTLRL